MKCQLISLVLLVGAGAAFAQPQVDQATPAPKERPPSDQSSRPRTLDAGSVNFINAPLAVVLDIYAQLSGRVLVQSQRVRPTVPVTYLNKRDLTVDELLEELDGVMFSSRVEVVLIGKKHAVVVAATEVPRWEKDRGYWQGRVEHWSGLAKSKLADGTELLKSLTHQEAASIYGRISGHSVTVSDSVALSARELLFHAPSPLTAGEAAVALELMFASRQMRLIADGVGKPRLVHVNEAPRR